MWGSGRHSPGQIPWQPHRVAIRKRRERDAWHRASLPLTRSASAGALATCSAMGTKVAALFPVGDGPSKLDRMLDPLGGRLGRSLHSRSAMSF